MPYQDSSYQDSSYQDSNYTGGGDPFEEPLFGPPLLWQAVLDDLSIFFGELGGPVTAHGADQNSYYNGSEDSAPLDAMFLQDFGWMPTFQNMPDAHYFDYLTSDVDPEFLLTAYSDQEVIANFSHGQVSVEQLSDGTTFAFNLNGITVFGTWHAGGPTTQSGNTIIVTGGHWTFQYTGFDAAHYNGQPPPPPPIQDAAPSADAAAAAANPEGIAEQHRQALSEQIHAFLNDHGGHFLVTFKGPHGNETFDLADLVNILDHYHIVATGDSFLHTSGGAGAVHPDGHGGWVTDFNRAQLVGYETMAGNMLDFIILHEVTHMLPNGLSYTHTQYQDWRVGGGTQATYTGGNGFDGSVALFRSESYSNNMAAAVEHLIDLTPPSHPAGGYDYTGLPGGH